MFMRMRHLVWILVGFFAACLSNIFFPSSSLDLSRWTMEVEESFQSTSTSSVLQAFALLDAEDVRNSNAETTIYGNITTALCHKTLFGDVDLSTVALWAKYNHLLGFDHIFIGYLPDVANLTGFQKLADLPYITMYKNTLGRLKRYPMGYLRIDRSRPGDQLWDIKECLSNFAKSYDWVFLADSDEFLWFNQTVPLKEFLHLYRDFNYLSFGKYVYTAHQGVELEYKDPFGLAQFPFAVGSLCFTYKQNRNTGSPYCPGWHGRSKVIVRPTHFTNLIDVHMGVKMPNISRGEIHFYTHEAHIKEWPAIFKPNRNITLRNPESYTVWGNQSDACSSLKVHNFPMGYKWVNGNKDLYNVYYDDQLKDWMQFILSLEPVP